MRHLYILALCAGISLVASPPALAQKDPADSVYTRARRALDDKNYDAAARAFDAIITRFPRSAFAPDALYWKGFALYRSGNLEGAAAALEAQAQRYPNAPTRRDAAPLLILVKAELAKRGDTTARQDVTRAASSSQDPCRDMEVRAAALDAVQQMDADRALPLLRRVLALRDECSAPLRKNALFILAQKSGPDRDRMLLDIARSDPSTAVRNDAVFYLGQATSDAAIDALQEILLHGDEDGVRDNALFALAQMQTDRTRKIIQDFTMLDAAPMSLRKNALFHGAAQPGPETNTWLVSLIGNAKAPMNLRRDAIFHLAQKDDASDQLAGVYDTALPTELKKELLFHIAQRSDDASLLKLIAIARGESNPELRKDALFHLGQSKDPRALKALEDIVAP